jgi:hypothetical protein
MLAKRMLAKRPGLPQNLFLRAQARSRPTLATTYPIQSLLKWKPCLLHLVLDMSRFILTLSQKFYPVLVLYHLFWVYLKQILLLLLFILAIAYYFYRTNMVRPLANKMLLWEESQIRYHHIRCQAGISHRLAARLMRIPGLLQLFIKPSPLCFIFIASISLALANLYHFAYILT